MVPLITAKTRRLVMELGKDDKRPMDERGTTSDKYAPFAEASNVGLLGEEEIAEMEEKQRSEAMGNRKIKDPDFYNYDAEEDYDVLRPTDVEANPRNRGQDKVPTPYSSYLSLLLLLILSNTDDAVVSTATAVVSTATDVVSTATAVVSTATAVVSTAAAVIPTTAAVVSTANTADGECDCPE